MKKLSKFISLKDILAVIVYLVGLGIAWGGMTTKLQVVEETTQDLKNQVKEVSSVKEDIAVIKVQLKSNTALTRELRLDMKEVLSKLGHSSR